MDPSAATASDLFVAQQPSVPEVPEVDTVAQQPSVPEVDTRPVAESLPVAQAHYEVAEETSSKDYEEKEEVAPGLR